MIRFIDIRRQGTGSRFAFFDTVSHQFCMFEGAEVWKTDSEFAESFAADGGIFSDGVRRSGIERFTDLMPEWVNTPYSDDDF